MDRLDVYNQLPDALKPLYEGTDPRLEIFDTAVQEFNLDKNQKKKLIATFGDVVLGLESVNNFANALDSHIGSATTATITTQLKPLFAFIDTHRTATDTNTETTQKEFSTPPMVAEDDKQSTKTTPVAPLHTMATDIEKIHGYGAVAQQETTTESNEPVHTSSQDSVLARPKVADMPSYTPEPTTDFSATKPDVPPAPTPSTPAAPTGLPINNASTPSFTPTSSKPTNPTDAQEPAPSTSTKPDTRWSSSLDNS